MMPDRRKVGSITLRVIVPTLPALTGAGFFVALDLTTGYRVD
jgi:hypothetical protein